jgi:hypothetical protein
MLNPRGVKQLANEIECPNVVELAFDAGGLDVELSRRIAQFHELRSIQPRSGRTVLRQREVHYRWCFSDSVTAHAFVKQFGGAFYKSNVGQVADAR